MLAEVKKCADSQDIKGLRYIFVDCLDVDPTFEKYRADYEFCKNIDGLFEEHSDLHGIISDKSKWNLQYWEQLKVDLMKNFSEKRFEHMVKVAKVVYADKIERLLSERGTKRAEIEKKLEEVTPKVSQLKPVEKPIIQKPRQPEIQGVKTGTTVDNPQTIAYQQLNKPVKTIPIVEVPKKMTDAELQEKQLEDKRKALEAENQRIEAEQRAQQARIEAAKRENMARKAAGAGDSESKKWLGIVLLIIAVIIVGIAITVLH